MTQCSPEAARAISEARDARVSTEAMKPLVDKMSREIRAQVAASEFLDLIETIASLRLVS